MNLSNLKLQWLIFFYDVTQTLNFTRTAEQHFTSQSNVSYAIRSLETELGVQLFVRKDKEITLSKYGKAFLPYVEKALHDLNSGCRAIQEIINPISGEVNIAFSYIFALDTIPDLFKFLYLDFMNNNLNIQLNSVMSDINSVDTRCIEDMVLDGTCDIGLTCVQSRDGIIYDYLTDLEHVLLLPKTHRLADSKMLTLHDVKEEPFILLEGDSSLLRYYPRMFAYEGLKPNLVSPGLDWLSILLCVSSGRCLTISPIGRFDDYDIAAVPLEHDMAMRPVYIATSAFRKLSPTAQYVKNKITDYFKPNTDFR